MKKSKRIYKIIALMTFLAIAVSLVFPLSDVIDFGNGASADDSSTATLDVYVEWNNKQKSLSDSSKSDYWFAEDGTETHNSTTYTKYKFNHWTKTTDATKYPVVWVTNENGEYKKEYTAETAGNAKNGLLYVKTLTTDGGKSGDSIGSKCYGNGADYNGKAFYTVSEDADGYLYATYYISTAFQLKDLLQQSPSDLWKGTGVAASDGNKGGTNKICFKLLCDIDLGGKNNTTWYFNGKSWSDYILDFDGDGHTIYNGKFTENGYFISVGSNYKGLSIRNVTFSNMDLERNGGLFGHSAKHIYLYNVDFTDCYATSSSDATTIVLGHSYNYCFFKECTVKNSYIYTTGGHGAFLASYNGIGECNNDNGSPYTTSIPSNLDEVEKLWESNDKTINDNYPNIFEDCQTIDSEIYFGKSGTEHQGTFVSCIQGAEIFKRCFSNCMAYGDSKIGVFTGACIGSGNGFKMTINGEEVYVNTYFEDCFTSGTIEGSSRIGGFIGMIFDDPRADGDSNDDPNNYIDGDRGICYFKNCYSTSSVGMQYSGNYVGGFAGYVRAYTNCNVENSTTQAHRFVNCYAAGEVGGIITDTSTENTNKETIGGFVGTYDDGFNTKTTTNTVSEKGATTHNNAAIDATNCYYDKQTTAMRERGVGDDSASYDLNSVEYENQTAGLTGIYTQASSEKNVLGLTDSDEVLFENSSGKDTSSYYYLAEYYPQIKDILNVEINDDSSMTDSEKMLNNRAKIKKYCSLASTAAVFLSHYDSTLSKTQEGVEEEIIETPADTTYDTVRDITRVFTFTSSTLDELAVAWEKNEELNEEGSFSDYLGGTTDTSGNKTAKGYTLDYSYKSTDGTNATYTKTFRQEVLDLVYTENKYECVSFAPGKQWVQVQIGEIDEASTETPQGIDSSEYVGKRNLRLLPTASIDAGDMVKVTVNTEGYTGDSKYSVKLTDVIYNNANNLEISTFNHAIGVAYAISDKNRMIGNSYAGQTVKEYSGNNAYSVFAITGKYRVFNSSSAMDSTINAEFNKQLFSGLTKSDSTTKQDNTSDESGLTMVKVWKAAADDSGEMQDDTYVPISKDTKSEYYKNYQKWSGLEQFDSDDVGYYYLHYYWRLDDGRYLEDIKLVNISTADAYVEMRTGILDSSLPDDYSADDIISINDIDQYVYSDAKSSQGSEMTTDNLTEWDTNGSLYWDKSYPTQSSSYTDTNYNGDNSKLELYSDSEYTYSMKSVKKVTSSSSNVVGWYNTSDYKMTTLILEVQNGGEWSEMERINLENGGDVYSLDGAEYSATFVSYTVTQDSKTRKYTVTKQNTGDSVTFKVETYDADSTNSHKVKTTANSGTATKEAVEEERYIVLSVTHNNSTATELQNPIRVTALYRQADAEINPQKEVLLPDSTEDSDPNSAYTAENTVTTESSSYYTESLKQADDDRSMDNYGKASDATDRHAVLEGDTLTYRVKLKNVGYNAASVVSLDDAIPDGCTYIDGSAKVYSQYVDFSSNVIKYNAAVALDSTEYTANCESNTLTVTFTEEIDFRNEYYLYFKVKVGVLKASDATGKVDNTALLTYTDSKKNTKSTDEKSNTVTTDQVHLYFKIQKNITSADVGRSFLFRVDRYNSSTDTSPAETYYVNLSFDDSDGTSAAKLLQTDKDGYYVVTEIDDWSETDYVAYSGSDTEIATHSFTLRGTDNLYDFYTANTNASTTDCNTAVFSNTLDEYAYSDSQAYIDNKINADKITA